MIVMLKMQVSQNGLKVNVTKHLTLLLFIGLTFWGCEDEEPTLIGSWEYVDYEAIIVQLSDSSYLSEIDSIVEEGHNYRREIQLTYTFTEDSVATNEGEYESCSISNDTLNLQYWSPRFELIDDILRIGVRSARTDSTGALKYEYDEWWIFDRM